MSPEIGGCAELVGLLESSVGEDSNQKLSSLTWMNSTEAAAYIRTTPGALRTMVCRGQIKPKKLLSRNRFRRSDLDKLMKD